MANSDSSQMAEESAVMRRVGLLKLASYSGDRTRGIASKSQQTKKHLGRGGIFSPISSSIKSVLEFVLCLCMLAVAEGLILCSSLVSFDFFTHARAEGHFN